MAENDNDNGNGEAIKRGRGRPKSNETLMKELEDATEKAIAYELDHQVKANIGRLSQGTLVAEIGFRILGHWITVPLWIAHTE